MAKQADSGYVDENLRLFSSEQIYVCDGSVFPTAGNANPTLTCMALGARLARHLARG
jgi:choline dehydrogenase-like flavoprotein